MIRIRRRRTSAVAALVGLLVSGVTVVPVLGAGPLAQRCTNAEYGFSVSYPDDWHTNEPGDVFGSPVAACTLFAPFADIAVLPEASNVPIFLKHQGSTPTDGTSVTVDGRTGVVVETEVNGVAWYAYYVPIGGGMDFVGFAFDNGSAPFDESRAVLDAMMATINLDGDPMLPDVALPAGATTAGYPVVLAGGALLLAASWRLRRLLGAERMAPPR